MDFRELSYITAIAKYQHITKAAESLYVTQPTLSKFLKALEDDLGLKLFRRLGNRYVLTHAGSCYLQKARQILQLKNELDLELADIMKRDVGILRVAFPTMRCTYMLPATLPDFQKLHPHVKVEIIEDHSDQLDQKILNGEVEVAFYSQPPKISDLITYDVLEKEELLICTCKGHALAKYAVFNPESKYPKVPLSALKNERILMMRSSQRTRQIMEDYLKKHDITFENVMYTSNIPAIMELVSVGYGVSFIFEPHLRHHFHQNSLDCYSFGEPCIIANFVAAYRKGSYLPVYARDFIHIVRRLCHT